jgi:hypothetical protein
MKKHIKAVTSVAALGIGLAACSGGNPTLNPAQPHQAGPTPSPTPAVSYTQIERLSRPAVKEVFERFVDHQTSNAVEPYNDPTLQNSIVAVEDALRPPNAKVGSDYGKAIASVVYPDEYTVDLSQTSQSFLGYEATGGKNFGGRNPNEDVVALELSVLFGNTLSVLGLQPEDNEENNCLSKQNVAQRTSQQTTGTFPYLAKPH